MIIRSYFSCETCGEAHIVRIGLGQEAYSEHRFACTACEEEMVVGLRAAPEQHTAFPEAVENAVHSREPIEGTVVNLDANFLIPDAARHVDGVFPRLEQMDDIIHAALDANGGALPDGPPPESLVGIQAEWKQLKKAWSLARNGRTKLSHRKVADASATIYQQDPLTSLTDWLWRFCLFAGGRSYHMLFEAAIDEVKPLIGTDRLTAFLEYYENERAAREARYFEIFRTFFSSYSEFGQVWYALQHGIAIKDGAKTASTGFEQVRMFYGEAFETFSAHVDLFACLNNMVLGRDFDTFGQMTLAKYLTLDKASRFNPFIMNAPFTALCTEQDNTLRNASHHGGMRFDAPSQLITFRAGKGGQGPEQALSYAVYLARSGHLLLQCMKLLQIEIMICHLAGVPAIGSHDEKR